MRQRGRKSASSLSVVPVVEDERPRPPSGLSAAEKRVWRDTVDRLPPHWFRTSVPVLEVYCGAVEMARNLSEMLKTIGPTDERFADLVKLQRAEAALVARLAGTLRLTPRSTWSRTPQLVAATKPWQLGGGGAALVRDGRRFDERQEAEEKPAQSNFGCGYKGDDGDEPPGAA